MYEPLPDVSEAHEPLPDISEDQDTKTKIFMVAAHLFAEKGYDGVSMREISEQSEVSKPTIYYYFGSKEGIYKELLDTGLVHILATHERIQALDTTVKEKLVELMKSYFRLSLKYPEFVKFFLSLFTDSGNVPFLQIFKSEAIQRFQVLTNMIVEGIESGEFGANANPQLATEIIGGVLMHFIWQQLNSKEIILTDQLAEQIIEMLFKGLNE